MRTILISITIALELYRRSSKAIVIRVIFIKLWFQFFPFRWFHAHEFFYEEIETLVFSVAFAHAVPYARQDHQLEILVGFDEGIDHLHGGGRIHVVVHFSYHEHQRTRQPVGVFHVGASDVAAVHRIAHPLFVPPDFVHPVVVATATGVGCLVEFRVEKYGGQSFLSSGRATVYPHTGTVHIGVLFRCRLDPLDTVGETGVFQVLIAHLFPR